MRHLKIACTLLLLFVLSNCETQREGVFVPNNAEKAHIEQVGEPIAQELMKTLIGALGKAVEEGGAENAIGICNSDALVLTASMVAESDAITAVKRASARYRNPRNAPDSLEQVALDFFESALQQSGQLPPAFTQKIVRNGETHYRYYKPLAVAAVCTTCHGEPQQIAEGIKMKLATLYPEDRALGYKPGDFRGVIRVSLR